MNMQSMKFGIVVLSPELTGLPSAWMVLLPAIEALYVKPSVVEPCDAYVLLKMREFWRRLLSVMMP